MGKSKRKYDRDEYDSEPSQAETQSAPSVLDFVSYHKVEALRLRSYFQAYPRPLGDPLVNYLELLGAQGFRMITGVAGEPIICVDYR